MTFTYDMVALPDDDDLRAEVIAILLSYSALQSPTAPIVLKEGDGWTVAAAFEMPGYGPGGKAWAGGTQRTKRDPRDLAHEFGREAAAHRAKLETFFGALAGESPPELEETAAEVLPTEAVQPAGAGFEDVPLAAASETVTAPADVGPVQITWPSFGGPDEGDPEEEEDEESVSGETLDEPDPDGDVEGADPAGNEEMTVWADKVADAMLDTFLGELGEAPPARPRDEIQQFIAPTEQHPEPSVIFGHRPEPSPGIMIDRDDIGRLRAEVRGKIAEERRIRLDADTDPSRWAWLYEQAATYWNLGALKAPISEQLQWAYRDFMDADHKRRMIEQHADALDRTASTADEATLLAMLDRPWGN